MEINALAACRNWRADCFEDGDPRAPAPLAAGRRIVQRVTSNLSIMDVSIINEPAGIAAPNPASVRGTPDGAGFRDALELAARRRSADDRAASARDVERTRQRRAESDRADRADEADRRREPTAEAEEAPRPEKADRRQRTAARDETEDARPDPSHGRDEAAPAPENAPKTDESTTVTGAGGKLAQDAAAQTTAAAASRTDAVTATATETASNAAAAAGQPVTAGAPAAPAPVVNATPPAEKAGKTRPAGPTPKDASPSHTAAAGPDGAAAPAKLQRAAAAPDAPGAKTTAVPRGDEAPRADDILDLEGLWHRIAGKTKKPTSDGPSGTATAHKPDSNPVAARPDAGTMAGAVAKAQPQPQPLAAGTPATPLGDSGLRQDPATGSQPITGIGAAHGAGGNAAAQASPTAPMRAAAPGQPPTVQVAIHIARAVQDGQNRISIRLDPPELGRVDVKLDVGHDGKVIAAVAVDRPDTLDLLQRDVRGLERALQDAGLQTDGNSLNFSLRRQDQQPDPRFAQNPPSGRAEQGGPPPDERPRPIVAMRPASSRALDISI